MQHGPWIQCTFTRHVLSYTTWSSEVGVDGSPDVFFSFFFFLFSFFFSFFIFFSFFFLFFFSFLSLFFFFIYFFSPGRPFPAQRPSSSSDDARRRRRQIVRPRAGRPGGGVTETHVCA